MAFYGRPEPGPVALVVETVEPDGSVDVVEIVAIAADPGMEAQPGMG
jgi:hypothetical protein